MDTDDHVPILNANHHCKMNKSMFGSNFKYVLVLTALAWIVFTLPTVKAALQDVGQFAVPQTDISDI
jgi:hypothetical protein